jgi:hypothetical protein
MVRWRAIGASDPAFLPRSSLKDLAIPRGLETRAARGQYAEESVFGLIRWSYLIAGRSYILQQFHRNFVA